MTMSENISIGGTLVQSYKICSRQVWFEAHRIEQDQENDFLMMGRLIDLNSYKREKKSIEFGGSRFDIIRKEKSILVVGEVKKSSHSIDAARLQLAHYLYELSKSGIGARGELLIPKEKKREKIILTEELKTKLDNIYIEIIKIASFTSPPHAPKCKYCKNCAYSELCWS
jgi:CRISPR-associated exonuclease Cas4